MMLMRIIITTLVAGLSLSSPHGSASAEVETVMLIDKQGNIFEQDLPVVSEEVAGAAELPFLWSGNKHSVSVVLPRGAKQKETTWDTYNTETGKAHITVSLAGGEESVTLDIVPADTPESTQVTVKESWKKFVVPPADTQVVRAMGLSDPVEARAAAAACLLQFQPMMDVPSYCHLTPDAEAGIKLLERAARLASKTDPDGTARLYYHLGEYYLTQGAVSEARSAFRNASNHGNHLGAQNMYGYMAFMGIGGDSKPSEAIRYLENNIHTNNELVIHSLALAYSKGVGVPPDPFRAYIVCNMGIVKATEATRTKFSYPDCVEESGIRLTPDQRERALTEAKRLLN